jgi:diguanylate cyclase (GGDEF)-like protein/PAS domain S-box-containing protein
LRKTLGGSAEQVHQHILRIGRGDFTAAIEVAPGMEGSVLAGLAAMQFKLLQNEEERRQAEAELRASAERLNEAQRIARVGSWTLDIVSGKLIWSDEIFRLFEIDPQQFGATYQAFLDAVHPDDREAVNRAYVDSLDNRMPYEISHRLRMSDGRIKWVHEKCVSDFDLAGNPLRSHGTVQDITERKRIELDLVTSEARLRAVLDGVHNAVITITESGTIESFNRSAELLFGYSAAEVVGNNVSMLMPEPYRTAHDGYLDAYRRSGIRKVIGSKRDVMGRHRDGSVFHIELGVSETRIDDRRMFVGSISDISFRKEAEAELRIAATAFESQAGMMVTDPSGVILRVNRAFTETTGYSAADIVGKTPGLLKSGRHDAAFYAAMWESLRKTGTWQGEVWDRRKNGEIYPKWLAISAVEDEGGTVTHYVGAHQDITERKIAEERIKELAFFDQLTGLPNRTLLLDRLHQSMTASSRSGCHGALLFIDLDNFKTLNDTLGHDMGDILLRQVAQRLVGSVREGDTVARLGGDEFVVALGSLSENLDEAATQTEAVGGKILAALNGSYLLQDTEYRSSASIGATLFRGHQASVDDLMKQADLAMYKSKARGRNVFHFFDPDMETVVMERVSLEKDLREAIQKGQLALHYQAQVVGDGRVTGAEALLRWQHPQRGAVSPAVFIPLAEETGLILALGNWVLEAACAQLARWATRPEMVHLSVAVNVSARQFHETDFVEQVLAVIARSGANPNRLKLELTESLLVDRVEEVIEKMFALKAKGIGFSLDDFGTGYSSLSYLKRLPLDQLKIDQSFVRDVLVDPNDAAIARTIVALAQSLGLGVIAEGVETAAQMAFLATAGCHAYQGYFFSRPLPVEDFEEFARRA